MNCGRKKKRILQCYAIITFFIQFWLKVRSIVYVSAQLPYFFCNKWTSISHRKLLNLALQTKMVLAWTHQILSSTASLHLILEQPFPLVNTVPWENFLLCASSTHCILSSHYVCRQCELFVQHMAFLITSLSPLSTAFPDWTDYSSLTFSFKPVKLFLGLLSESLCLAGFACVSDEHFVQLYLCFPSH